MRLKFKEFEEFKKLVSQYYFNSTSISEDAKDCATVLIQHTQKGNPEEELFNGMFDVLSPDDQQKITRLLSIDDSQETSSKKPKTQKYLGTNIAPSTEAIEEIEHWSSDSEAPLKEDDLHLPKIICFVKAEQHTYALNILIEKNFDIIPVDLQLMKAIFFRLLSDATDDATCIQCVFTPDNKNPINITLETVQWSPIKSNPPSSYFKVSIDANSNNVPDISAFITGEINGDRKALAQAIKNQIINYYVLNFHYITNLATKKPTMAWNLLQKFNSHGDIKINMATPEEFCELHKKGSQVIAFENIKKTVSLYAVEGEYYDSDYGTACTGQTLNFCLFAQNKEEKSDQESAEFYVKENFLNSAFHLTSAFHLKRQASTNKNKSVSSTDIQKEKLTFSQLARNYESVGLRVGGIYVDGKEIKYLAISAIYYYFSTLYENLTTKRGIYTKDEEINNALDRMITQQSLPLGKEFYKRKFTAYVRLRESGALNSGTILVKDINTDKSLFKLFQQPSWPIEIQKIVPFDDDFLKEEVANPQIFQYINTIQETPHYNRENFSHDFSYGSSSTRLFTQPSWKGKKRCTEQTRCYDQQPNQPLLQNK